jgi:LysW-gamma-L-lysine carboxypeptidase
VSVHSGNTPEDALLRAMVEIDSPSGKEHELAAYLAGCLPSWGFDSHIDEAGNVIARRGDPAAPMIILVGHMDTVPDPVRVRQEGSLLYGRGTVDAKGPLATMICAGARADLGGAQLVVAGVVEEETTGRGATHLAPTMRPAVGVVGEPNGWAGVGIGYKGRFMASYTVTRRPVHTASPEEKATEAAITFWNRVTEHLASFPGELVFDRPVPTLVDMAGTIERASLTFSCRTPTGFDLPAFEALLAEAAVDATVEVEDRTPAVRVDPAGLAVRALCAGIRAAGGRPRLKLKSGTADLNIVAPVWQVPMAVYGPGDSALDHTDTEHIDLAEYATAIEVLQTAVERMAAQL